jgi:hypothetical protein
MRLKRNIAAFGGPGGHSDFLRGGRDTDGGRHANVDPDGNSHGQSRNAAVADP